MCLGKVRRWQAEVVYLGEVGRKDLVAQRAGPARCLRARHTPKADAGVLFCLSACLQGPQGTE